MINEINCPISPEQKNEIFSSFRLEQNRNKNIFFIITDGSYLILQFTFDVISKIDKELQLARNLSPVSGSHG